MNKRQIAFLSILSLFLSLSLIPVNAAVKAGDKCSKLNSTAIASGKKYICIKSGNKMAWNKGVKVATTTPTQPEATGKVIAALTTPEYLPNPPKGGNDEYRCFLLDPKFTKETFLESVTITPGNMKVSHHGILYRLPKASVAVTKELDQESNDPGWSCFGDTGLPGASAFSGAEASSWVTFWAPGGNFKSFPISTAIKFSAGDQFILQSHFAIISGHAGHAGGTVQADKSNSVTTKIEFSKAASNVNELKTMLIAAPIEVACGANESGPLCKRNAALADLAKRTSEKAAMQEAGLLYNCGKDPRNPVANPISECTEIIESSRKIYGSTPHMHQLGKKVSVWHTSAATGFRTNLSDRVSWNFDNQTTDWLTKPIDAKYGDTISISCTFDVGLRSILPIYKDLSPNYIVWGEGTRDEMCLGIINYTD